MTTLHAFTPKGIKREYGAVWSRGGEVRGELTGAAHHCQLEGCSGLRLSVVWPDGRRTFPCTKGLVARPDGEHQIG